MYELPSSLWYPNNVTVDNTPVSPFHRRKAYKAILRANRYLLAGVPAPMAGLLKAEAWRMARLGPGEPVERLAAPGDMWIDKATAVTLTGLRQHRITRAMNRGLLKSLDGKVSLNEMDGFAKLWKSRRLRCP